MRKIRKVEEKFRTRVAGVSYRQEAVSRCNEGQVVTLVRDPENEHDSNAVEVYAGEPIGYIPTEDSEAVARYLDFVHYANRLPDGEEVLMITRNGSGVHRCKVQLGENMKERLLIKDSLMAQDWHVPWKGKKAPPAKARIYRLTGGTAGKPTRGVVIEMNFHMGIYDFVQNNPDILKLLSLPEKERKRKTQEEKNKLEEEMMIREEKTREIQRIKSKFSFKMADMVLNGIVGYFIWSRTESGFIFNFILFCFVISILVL